MRLVIFSTISLLILTSCQSNENDVEPDGNTEEATVESSDESANDRTSKEKTSNEQPETDGSSEAPTEEDVNSEKEGEGTASPEESGDDSSNPDATSFDIHSDEVQQALFDSGSVKTENLTFSQDVITKGMSQSEVEERYGPYDWIYPGHGSPVVIYGNLGVNYSEVFPYGTNDEQADEDINPDENIVEDVKFYAGLPYDEVVDALGAPDVDVYETEGGPVSGLQLMEYVIEDKEESTITGTFWLHDNESGEKIVDLMTVDEVPDHMEESTVREPQESEDVSEDEEERMKAFISNYTDDLTNYYNNDEEDILTFTREESPNYEKISVNKASGNYRNHRTYDVDVIDIKNNETNEYEVTVTRNYEHISSNGRRTTVVEYTIVNTPQGFMIYDYEEIDNEPVY